MRSVSSSEEDHRAYGFLFGDQIDERRPVSDQSRSREETISLVRDVWARRWKLHDPYSSLAVFKNLTGEFVGHIMLDHGSESGEAVLVCVFNENRWEFGAEAVTAVVREYAPAIMREGYTLNGNCLEKITTAVRADDSGTASLLQTVGMQKVDEEEQFGVVQHRFSIVAADLPQYDCI
jgi:hypothetical protein